MKKNGFLLLSVFVIGGITFRWLIEFVDLLMQILANWHTVKTTKMQLEVNDITNQIQLSSQEVDTNAVGFAMPETYEEDDFDE